MTAHAQPIVLVLHRDAALRERLCELLEAEGYAVYEGDDPQGTLTGEPWPSPDADGPTVCAIVEAEMAVAWMADCDDMPCAVLTGASKEQQASALEAGADEVLADPGDPNEVRVRVRTLTRIARLTAQLRARTAHQSTLEQRLYTAQRLESVGKLASGVAHDFNNLLTAIISFSGFVFEELALGDPRREDMEEVIAAAEKAATLTRQLLHFSRQRPGEVEPVEVNGQLEGLLRILRRTLGEDVELHIVPSRSPAVVLVDPGRLDQIIMNLAVNARDAMPDGGRLTVSVEHVYPSEGERVQIQVADTGVGMDEATLTRIFEPFFTTKGTDGGTGLGLATCFEVVHQLGGQIGVRSALGEGTTFTVTLPSTLASVVDESRVAELAKTPLASETVLVVEDDPAIVIVARRALESDGYRVLVATDADVARELLESEGEAIGVVFSDVVLPKGNGYELAAWARKRRPGLPILMASGYTDERVVQGDSPFPLCLKPYTPAELRRQLRACIDASQD